MILPIVVYGDPVLRKMGEDIDTDYEGLDALIKSMFDTMYNASGVGLAAPQIGKAIRLFVIDTHPFAESDDEEDDEEFTAEQRKELKAFKKVFINARIVKEEGTEWKFNEGCLSIPKINTMALLLVSYNTNMITLKENYLQILLVRLNVN